MSNNDNNKDMKEVVERKLVDEMLRLFIIPNWYKPKDFEQMKGWDEEKVERFKNYLSKCVCSHDGIKEYVEEVLENFIQDNKESSDEEDDEE